MIIITQIYQNIFSVKVIKLMLHFHRSSKKHYENISNQRKITKNYEKINELLSIMIFKMI